MRKPQIIAWLMDCLWKVILFALFGGERTDPTPTKPTSRKVKKKTRRAQHLLEDQVDYRLLGGQIIPGTIVDYLHHAKTAIAAGEYKLARWNQAYVRKWLRHHP